RENASDTKAADKIRPADVGDHRLEWFVDFHFRRLDRFHHEIEQRLQRAFHFFFDKLRDVIRVRRAPAFARTSIDDREVRLLFARAKVDEEIKRLVDHFRRTDAVTDFRSINFVYAENN